jgi:putative transposase
MTRSKHTEAQMIAAVKQMEAGRKAEDVAREVGGERAHHQCLEVEVRRHGCERGQEAKRLRDENSRLRKLVGDLSLDKEALQSVKEKKGCSSRRRRHMSSTSGRSSPSPNAGPAACCWFRYRAIVTSLGRTTTAYVSV